MEGEIRIDVESDCVKLRFFSPIRNQRLLRITFWPLVTVILTYIATRYPPTNRNGKSHLALLGMIVLIIGAFTQSLREFFNRNRTNLITASPDGLFIRDDFEQRTIPKAMFLRVIVRNRRFFRKPALVAVPRALKPSNSFWPKKRQEQIPESGIVLISHSDAALLVRAAEAINEQFRSANADSTD